jgi:hypothetical protein
MEAPHYVLLTKYYSRGTLLTLLHDKPQLSWQHRLGLALQVMRQEGAAHRLL